MQMLLPAERRGKLANNNVHLHAHRIELKEDQGVTCTMLYCPTSDESFVFRNL